MSEDQVMPLVSIQMNMFDAGEEATKELIVPVGGPNPLAVIASDFSKFSGEKPSVQFKIYTSGIPDTESFITLVRGLLEHMEKHEHYEVDDNGVTMHPPLTAEKEQG